MHPQRWSSGSGERPGDPAVAVERGAEDWNDLIEEALLSRLLQREENVTEPEAELDQKTRGSTNRTNGSRTSNHGIAGPRTHTLPQQATIGDRRVPDPQDDEDDDVRTIRLSRSEGSRDCGLSPTRLCENEETTAVHTEAPSSRLVRRYTAFFPSEMLKEHAEELGVSNPTVTCRPPSSCGRSCSASPPTAGTPGSSTRVISVY